jgi:hypothetical protein
MPDDPVIPPAGEPWYKGADDTVVGVLQQRGLADKPAPEVLANLVKAHAEAERLIGAPANEIVRWPKDSNDPNWANIRARLGVPTDAKEYDFSTIKTPAGADLDPEYVERIRTTAAALQLPKDQALALAKTIYEHEYNAQAKTTADRNAKIAAEDVALKTTWGPNYEANKLAATNIAKSMLVKSGMTMEDAANAVNALEQQVGGAKTMEMFRAFSRMANEDTFVDPVNPGGGPKGVMSYQEAVATKAALMRDEAFGAKWNSGDMAARNQLAALDTIIVNSAPLDDEAEFRRQLMGQAAYRG